MLAYILKRVLLMIPTLLGALTITFVVMQFVPGGPVEQILADLCRNGWVDAGSIVVVERAASSPPLNWPDGWIGWPSRRYGDTRLDVAEVGAETNSGSDPGAC